MYIAVAGPTIFGEKPRGTNLRDPIYDYYEEMNVNITGEFGIKYIPTRTTFFDNIPPWWPLQWGILKEYLTQDSEHLNGRGHNIIHRKFVDAINELGLFS